MTKYLNYLVIATAALSLANPLYARSKAMPPKALKDVPKSHWANDSVRELYESGVMVGDPNGNFRGASSMTRYEMAVALTSMMDHYNRELLEDREDLASLVNIMEQFQNELSALNQKLAELGINVGAVSGAMDQVQEQTQTVAVKVDETGQEVAGIREDVEKLKNRGLVFGTLSGVANDVRSVGKGATYVAKKIKSKTTGEDAQTQVEGEVVKSSPIIPASAMPVPPVVPITKTESAPLTVEEESIPVAKPAPAVETKTQKTITRKVRTDEVSPATTQVQQTTTTTTTHSYVPRTSTPVPQRNAYEAPKVETPTPKVSKVTEERQTHQHNQEMDGELIQEIHQTLQEMH